MGSQMGRTARSFVLCASTWAAACNGDGAAPAGRAMDLTRYFVYVTNEDSNDLAVIDPGERRVIARVPVGKRPRGLRVAPDGKTVYVALSGSPKAPPGQDPAALPPPDRAQDGIGVVDAASFRLLRVLSSGRDPEAFDLTKDGRALYVSNEETAEASRVEIATASVTHRVPVGGEPEGVTLHPSGRTVYVTSERDDRVTVIDTTTQRVLTEFSVGRRPRSVVFTRDGTLAFVTNELSASVTVVDAVHHRAIDRIAIPREGSGSIGPRPMGACLSPDDRTLYVSNGRGGSISVIDVVERRVGRTISEVGARPWGIAISPDGRTLFTANGPSNDVAMIDAATGEVTARVASGASPWGVAVSPAATGMRASRPPRPEAIDAEGAAIAHGRELGGD
jgi:YVTN family beta-propeller protein